ncbi:MAG: response regulator transcription factor [Bacteroidetes bacterium]|nr:response regulator transcription factor [Bacteroidota bacterium]
MFNILIADDDDDIRELVKYNLEKEGYCVQIAVDGIDCIEKIRLKKPDLILLDVMMPGMDGIEVCENIKSDESLNDVLICFLTARSEDYSQIAGLEAGGDDYVTKPIKPKVLLSRISAILRRKELKPIVTPPISEDLKINREKYLIEKNGQEIQLPRKEFELLALLMSRPNFVFKREIILEKVWGTDIIVGDRTIDVHIRKLRGKIGEDKINTVKGIGYKFCE